MNRIFLLLIFALLAVQTSAQAVRFIEEGKTWHVEGYTRGTQFPYEIKEDYCFTTESDTVIDDVHYMQLFEIKGDKMETAGIFREEEGIVYYYSPQLQQEFVFYDFTLNSANVVKIPKKIGYVCDYRCEVTGISHHPLADGTQVREIRLTATPLPEYGDNVDTENVWIEGVGNACHPLVNVVDDSLDGSPAYTELLVKQGGKVLYQRTANGIGNVNDAGKESSIYDLQGRPVRENTQHGILIKGGRKVWRK